MPETLGKTSLFCFNNVFHYVPLDLNYLLDIWENFYYFAIFNNFCYITCGCIIFLLYCKFIIFQMQVIVEYFSVMHLYSVSFVSYVWNVPYFFALGMYFTILYFYWIEFVAIMLWKSLIFSNLKLIISFYYQVLTHFWFVVLYFSQTLLKGFINSL